MCEVGNGALRVLELTDVQSERRLAVRSRIGLDHTLGSCPIQDREGLGECFASNRGVRSEAYGLYRFTHSLLVYAVVQHVRAGLPNAL